MFLPGGLPGESSLTSYSPWGHTESDTTEVTWQAHMHVPNWTAMPQVSVSIHWRGGFLHLLLIWENYSEDILIVKSQKKKKKAQGRNELGSNEAW